jgi:hypothetical protein
VTKTANSKPAAKRGVAETIKTAVNARTGNGLVIVTSKDRSLVIQRVDGKVNKLALVGQPIKPLEDYLKTQSKPEARLATGVNAHTAPHSAKSVEDSRNAARKTTSTAKGRKARGAVAATGKPAAKAKAGSMRGLATTPVKLTVLVKPKDAGLAVGSGRFAKLAFAAKCKTTADFLGKTVTDAAGKVHKCDAGALSGMVKRGHARLG